MMVSRVKYQSKLIPYSEIVQVIVQITEASIASNQLGQIPCDFSSPVMSIEIVTLHDVVNMETNSFDVHNFG